MTLDRTIFFFIAFRFHKWSNPVLEKQSKRDRVREREQSGSVHPWVDWRSMNSQLCRATKHSSWTRPPVDWRSFCTPSQADTVSCAAKDCLLAALPLFLSQPPWWACKTGLVTLPQPDRLINYPDLLLFHRWANYSVTEPVVYIHVF